MDQALAYLQNPFVIMIINGLIAGWLAGLLLGGGGLIRNLIVGIIGALLGGALVQMGLLNLPAAVTDVTNAIPFGTQILVSTIGAIIVVIIARIIAR
ncbi:MAG: GlsB/YeaQ/YmgE family stress response membrane protein [Hyphomicrobiaceae bacterium]|nr:GlsB/YeaQ/YmgE family stress response membrane protein [Hyphomicrobiaceae bacterium]